MTDSPRTIAAGYVISTVETARPRVYLHAMHLQALRLILLVAAMLMPLGMSVAPAAPASDHHSSHTVPPGHCSDEPAKRELGGIGSDCAMPCSSALPVIDATTDTVEAAPVVMHSPSNRRLAGIAPEIATPPPKAA